MRKLTLLTVVVCLLALAPPAHADLLTDLQGYWAFEETSGTTAFDTHTTGVDLGPLPCPRASGLIL